MNWFFCGISFVSAVAYCAIDIFYLNGALSGIVCILAFFAGGFFERAMKEGKQNKSS
jgi:hypothetical protein